MSNGDVLDDGNGQTSTERELRCEQAQSEDQSRLAAPLDPQKSSRDDAGDHGEELESKRATQDDDGGPTSLPDSRRRGFVSRLGHA